MKKILTLLTVLYLVLGLSIPVSAAPSSYNATLASLDQSTLTAVLSEKGIPDDKIQVILEKSRRGELPDSINPAKRAKIPEGTLNVTLEDPVKKIVFPDGTYIEKKITILNRIELSPENRQELINVVGSEEKADEIFAKAKELQNQSKITKKKGRFSILSVTPGSTYNIDNATWYTNCWVQEDATFTGGGFGADFVVVWGGVDYINQIYNPIPWCVAGTYSNVTLTMDRQYEAQYTGDPAKATLAWDYFATGGAFASRYHTSLYVGNNTYWSGLW